MRSLRAVLVGTVLMLTPLARVGAEPLDPQQVPADVKFVIHLDMDAVTASKMGDMITKKINSDTHMQAGINEIQIMSGMKIPQDLHDVTLYGRDFSPASGVVVIHAGTDQAKVLNALKLNPAYGSSTYGAYEIHTWQDKGKTLYGSYHGASVIVISQAQKNVEAALDLMDHKGAALKGSDPLAAGAGKGVLAYAAGTGLSTIKAEDHPRSPVLAQVDSATMAVSEQDPNMTLHGTIVALTVEAAEQIRTSLEGIRAMVTLTGTTENAPPKAKAAAEALTKLTIKAQDKTVTIDWPISLDQIQTCIENMGPRHGGAGATAPAAQ